MAECLANMGTRRWGQPPSLHLSAKITNAWILSTDSRHKRGQVRRIFKDLWPVTREPFSRSRLTDPGKINSCKSWSCSVTPIWLSHQIGYPLLSTPRPPRCMSQDITIIAISGFHPRTFCYRSLMEARTKLVQRVYFRVA